MVDQNVTLRKVACELEATYNTDAVNALITANTAPLILHDYRSVSITPVTTPVEIRRVRAHVSGVPSKTKQQNLAVNIEAALSGAVNLGVSAGEHSYLRSLLLASGFAETTVSGTSWTLKPTAGRNRAGKSASIWDFAQNEDNSLWRLIYATGCRFNPVFNFADADEAFVAFTGLSANFPNSADATGSKVWSNELQYFNATTGALSLNKAGTSFTHTPGNTYANKASFLTQSMTVLYDGVAVPVQSQTLDMGWQPSVKDVRNGASSVTAVYLQKARRAGGNLRIAETGTQWRKMIEAWLNATELSLVTTVTNGTQKFTFTIPKFQVVQPTSSPNGDTNAWDIGYAANANSNAGDDDVVIALTAA